MSNLKVTNVKFRFRKKKQSKNLIANIDIAINGELFIRSMKFVQSTQGYTYVQFPSHKVDGEFYNIVTASVELRAIINQAVAERWNYMKSIGLWKEDSD